MNIQGLVLSMCAVAAGCGGDGGDADTDTEITVLDDRWYGEPAPGLTVVFTEEARTQTAVTDEAGRATAALSGPAIVTVVRPPAPGGFSLVSVHGVLPGEQVVFGPPDRFSPPHAMVEVEVPPFAGAAPAYTYRVYTSCSSSARTGPGTRHTVSIDRPCDGDRMDVYVEAIDGTKLQASLTVTGQPAADGGVLVLAGTWELPRPLEVVFSDLPLDVSVSPDATAYYRGMRATASADDAFCPQAAATCLHRAWAAPTADRVAVDATLRNAEEVGIHQLVHVVFPWSQGPERTVPIRLLPWIGDAVFDPATRRATWRLSPGDTADATALLLYSDDVAWLQVAPPGIEELRAPDLTGIPGVGMSALAGSALFLYDRDDTTSYDDFRRTAEALVWTAGVDDVGARTSGAPVDTSDVASLRATIP